MSAPSQKTTPADSMDADTAKRNHLSGAEPAGLWAGPLREERLRTIRDLVRSDNYQVSAGLVAERMIERVMDGGRDSR